MLTIRAPQLLAFEAAAADRFEDRLLAGLRTYWPDECSRLGDDLHVVVQQGIARARSHQVVTQRGLFRYLNLMFLLGLEFDADPALPWARDVLANDAMTESQKLDELVDRASLARKAVAGV